MAPEPRAVLAFVARSSRRVAVSIVGGALVLLGIAMIVLPGPGILVAVLGFAVLGTEYAWAAAALERTRKIAEAAGARARTVAGGAAGSVGRTVRRPFRR